MYLLQWRYGEDTLYTIKAGICYLCCSLIYGRVHSGGNSWTWFCDIAPVLSWSLFTSGSHSVFLRYVMLTSRPFYHELFHYRYSHSLIHEASVEPRACLGIGSFSLSRSVLACVMFGMMVMCTVTKGSPGVLRIQGCSLGLDVSVSRQSQDMFLERLGLVKIWGLSLVSKRSPTTISRLQAHFQL